MFEVFDNISIMAENDCEYNFINKLSFESIDSESEGMLCSLNCVITQFGQTL